MATTFVELLRYLAVIKPCWLSKSSLFSTAIIVEEDILLALIIEAVIDVVVTAPWSVTCWSVGVEVFKAWDAVVAKEAVVAWDEVWACEEVPVKGPVKDPVNEPVTLELATVPVFIKFKACTVLLDEIAPLAVIGPPTNKEASKDSSN